MYARDVYLYHPTVRHTHVFVYTLLYQVEGISTYTPQYKGRLIADTTNLDPDHLQHLERVDYDVHALVNLVPVEIRNSVLANVKW